MLGLGWTEMLVIGVVALIVIGPKDLPVMMRRIGQFAGTVRRMGSEFQRELNKTTGLDEIRNLRSSITDPLRKTTDEIRREFNRVTPTGTQPSGAIKPADPKVESVVDEIKAAAGIKPEPAKALPAPKVAAVMSESKPAVKAAPRKRAAKVNPAPTAAVTKSELPPVESATTKPVKAAPSKTGPAKVSEPAADTAVKPKTTRARTAKAPAAEATTPAAKKPAPRRAKTATKS